MKHNVSTKKIDKLTEEDVLSSLESAISTFENKDFEQIAKKTLAKAKGGKRKKIEEVLKKREAIEEVITNLENELINNPQDTEILSQEINEVIEPIALPISEIAKAIKKTKSKSTNQKNQETTVATTKPVKSTKIATSKAATRKKARKTKTKRKGLFSKIFHSTAVTHETPHQPGRFKKAIINISLVMAMVTFVTLSSYIAYAYVSQNTNDIVSKVAEHVILPTGETPKVYIIQSEKSEIFQNPLFKGIKTGDNVLSYLKAGKVFIYRSNLDKVVNIVNTAQ